MLTCSTSTAAAQEGDPPTRERRNACGTRLIEDLPCEVCVSEEVNVECARRAGVDAARAKADQERAAAIGARDTAREGEEKAKAEARRLRDELERERIALALRPPPARVAGATLMGSGGAGIAVALVRLGMTGELDVGLVVVSGVQLVGGGLVWWWGGE
jgi:hypothetical protein